MMYFQMRKPAILSGSVECHKSGQHLVSASCYQINDEVQSRVTHTVVVVGGHLKSFSCDKSSCIEVFPIIRRVPTPDTLPSCQPYSSQIHTRRLDTDTAAHQRLNASITQLWQ